MSSVTRKQKPVWLTGAEGSKASAHIRSKGVKVRLWRGVEQLVVELLLPDEPACLWRTLVNVAASRGLNVAAASEFTFRSNIRMK